MKNTDANDFLLGGCFANLLHQTQDTTGLHTPALTDNNVPIDKLANSCKTN